MQFKDDSLKDELAHTPTLLQVMAEWFCALSQAHFQKDPVVTRVFEVIAGSSGVHEAHRAVDFRDQHAGGYMYTAEERRFLVSEMNRRFERADKKLSCIHHSFCGGAYHFHLQIGVEGVTKDLGEPDGNAVNSESAKET